MSRLIGRHSVTLDGKGRLVLPAQHRTRYEHGAVLSSKPDHLGVYEPAAWDRFADDLETARREGRISSSDASIITRSAAEVRVDTAGRVLIPAWMREQFDLSGEVMVSGNHTYLGIYPGSYLERLDPEAVRQAAAQAEALGL